jgi:UDP-3-O-[3-hydroxymyristoyl] glucosamine N-acyltransferase
MTLDTIASLLQWELAAGSDKEISGINTLKESVSGEISFLSDSKYEKDLATTNASCVIIPAAKAHLLPPHVIPICTEEPYLMVAKLSKLFAKPVVDSDVEPSLGANSVIYPTAHIEKGASIGANCTIMAGVYVGCNVIIGDNVTLYPNVCVYRDCTIGKNSIIHAGTVIGSDGFGYAHTKQGEYIKFYQNGNVVIEDEVEIGANTTIDCAVFGSTIIKRGTKIDNLIQIGHNCIVGEHSILVAQSGLAGSTTLGRNVVMGGQAATAGHLTIAPFSTFAARAGITKNVTKSGVYGGFPLMEQKAWLKFQAKLAKLFSL